MVFVRKSDKSLNKQATTLRPSRPQGPGPGAAGKTHFPGLRVLASALISLLAQVKKKCQHIDTIMCSKSSTHSLKEVDVSKVGVLKIMREKLDDPKALPPQLYSEKYGYLGVSILNYEFDLLRFTKAFAFMCQCKFSKFYIILLQSQKNSGFFHLESFTYYVSSQREA